MGNKWLGGLLHLFCYFIYFNADDGILLPEEVKQFSKNPADTGDSSATFQPASDSLAIFVSSDKSTKRTLPEMMSELTKKHNNIHKKI